MALNRKKIPKNVLELFDRYVENNVRHLNKPDAVNMLMQEFGLDEVQAGVMFESFDKDQNGVMSIWEFEQFFLCMGNHAQEIVKKFQELDKDGSGKLEQEEAIQGLKDIKTGAGRGLVDKEIEFFMKTTAGDDGVIDLAQFTNLLYRLKLYNAPPPK
ncbi:calcium-binding protein LPS1-beta-like [Pomacea canaliculata]|uniref:calcium-binding protein LPS1-beta-like n=1 Tax=Pomacea canaliculata TaxID=400727 RepID=UPI000D72E123|nr:calcium-binding protein LPS1-beta-like [Pomacea canaliculata]XP_025081569.1 calcium-binding protein LPS1-beta-like [Pomacea canaliculata]XP_025081570.1 calcium-binding protein LPS1-beta-like [Pomacea canaliculata]